MIFLIDQWKKQVGNDLTEAESFISARFGEKRRHLIGEGVVEPTFDASSADEIFGKERLGVSKDDRRRSYGGNNRLEFGSGWKTVVYVKREGNGGGAFKAWTAPGQFLYEKV